MSCIDIGSLHEVAAKRYCPKAQLTGYKTRDECTLALQSGRADVHILAAILGLAAIGKNPASGQLSSAGRSAGGAAELPRHPARAGHAVRRRDQCLDRLQPRHGQIREWLLDGLAKFGVTREQIPATLSF